MSVRFRDTFDNYGSTSDLLANWTGGQSAGNHFSWDATSGRFGGGCIKTDGTSSAVAIQSAHVFASTVNYVGFGFWFKCAAPPTSQQAFIWCFDVANGGKCELTMNTNGAAGHYNGSTPVINGSKNICDGFWHFVEWKTRCTSGSSSVAFYVDKVVDWSTGAANQAGGFMYFNLYNVPGQVSYYDDLLVWEDDGVFPQASDYPLGLLRAVTKRGTSDSAVSFATATGGSTHYNQINSVAPQTVNNVSDPNTSGHQDLYGMSATGVAASSIFGVGFSIYGNNSGGGTQNIRAAAKNGGTTLNGATLTMPTTPGMLQDFMINDPATSARWASVSAVDSAVMGFNIP